MSDDSFWGLGNFFNNLFSGGSTPQSTPAPTVDLSASNGNSSGQVAANANFMNPDSSATSTNTDPSLLSQAGSWLMNNGSTIGKVVSPLIAGGGLINSLVSNNSVPQKGAIQTIAGQQQAAAQPMIAGGTQIVNQANAGQLPAGVEQDLDNQLQSQIAAIKAKYAGMGLSGSTMEQQDIEGVQNQIQAQKAQEVLTYLTQGTNEINAGTGDLNNATNNYTQLAQEQMKQNEDMSAQISNFLKALTGGGQTTTTTVTGL